MWRLIVEMLIPLTTNDYTHTHTHEKVYFREVKRFVQDPEVL